MNPLEPVPADEDSKVRRNFVGFSALVILLAWLGVPLTAALDKVGLSQVHLDPLRLWVAVLAVLLYLALRFHFKGGGAKAFAELRKSYEMHLFWQMSEIFDKEREGPRRRLHWTPTLESVLAQRPPEPAEKGMGDLKFQLGFDAKDAPRKFQGSFVAHMHWLDVMHSVRGEQRRIEVQYRTPIHLETWNVVKAVWCSLVFSEDAVELLAPVWLAMLAALVAGFRIGTAALA